MAMMNSPPMKRHFRAHRLQPVSHPPLQAGLPEPHIKGLLHALPKALGQHFLHNSSGVIIISRSHAKPVVIRIAPIGKSCWSESSLLPWLTRACRCTRLVSLQRRNFGEILTRPGRCRWISNTPALSRRAAIWGELLSYVADSRSLTGDTVCRYPRWVAI